MDLTRTFFSFIFENESSLLLSLAAGLILSLILFFPSLGLAWVMVKHSGPLHFFLNALLWILLFLPPGFVGLLLLALFGTDGLTGLPLVLLSGYRGAYPCLGCILMGAVSAFICMFRCLKCALMQVDKESELAAKTLGIERKSIFFKIILPQAKSGIVLSLLLGFARAAGEYGAGALLLRSCFHNGGITGECMISIWIWDLLLLFLAALFYGFLYLFIFRKKKKLLRSGDAS